MTFYSVQRTLPPQQKLHRDGRDKTATKQREAPLGGLLTLIINKDKEIKWTTCLKILFFKYRV